MAEKNNDQSNKKSKKVTMIKVKNGKELKSNNGASIFNSGVLQDHVIIMYQDKNNSFHIYEAVCI